MLSLSLTSSPMQTIASCVFVTALGRTGVDMVGGCFVTLATASTSKLSAVRKSSR